MAKHFNHNCRIVRKKIQSPKLKGLSGFDSYSALFFEYDYNADISCSWSLLCEVGEPFKPEFKRLIRIKKLKLKTIDINVSPWVITVQDNT